MSSQGYLRPHSSESLPCSKSDTRIHRQDGSFQEWSQLEPIPHDGSDADRSDSNSDENDDEVFLEFQNRNSCCEIGAATEAQGLLQKTEDSPLVKEGSPMVDEVSSPNKPS